MGDLDAYISYQLDSIFAGLLVSPEKRAVGQRTRIVTKKKGRPKPAKKSR